MLLKLAGILSFAAVSTLYQGLFSTARAECRIAVQAEIPIRIERRRILIPGEINGQPVEFIFDTGAPESILLAASAADLKVPIRNMPRGGGGYLSLGGPVNVAEGLIDMLKIGPLAIPQARIVVGGKGQAGSRKVGFIGYDLFARHDIEIDPEHDRLRLIESSSDCSDRQLVYWGGPFHVAPLTQLRGEQGHGMVDVQVDGVTVPAILDTGSPRSTMALGAAALAGVTPTSPGAVPAGYTGFNGVHTPSWAVQVKTLKIGDDVFDGATIRISDLFGRQVVARSGSRIPMQADTASMLLGVDFLGTRRLIISRDHGKLLFGDDLEPVFQPLGRTPAPAPSDAGAGVHLPGAAS